jgi:hypothetical protein
MKMPPIIRATMCQKTLREGRSISLEEEQTPNVERPTLKAQS